MFNGRPAADFAAALPYASEIFGVYQPLAGWLGRRNTQRVVLGLADEARNLPLDLFKGVPARNLDNPLLSRLAARIQPGSQGVMSPVGLVSLYREYFFEFDTFLGVPVGHIWLSPGGTVEVIESSTRRMLVEKTAEQSEETTRKSEESLTQQGDVADAVKEDNANDTKLGASASAGANFAGIYHGDASASFSTQNTTKKSSEVTHKHTRTQSSKVSSEIHRNFKTTFRTVSESTDTTSRRYLVQNTSTNLVNYELRRKMRKVGIQVQHIGTRLSWQVFLDAPGRNLGLGDLVHIVPSPDLSSLRKPDPPAPLLPKDTPYTCVFPIITASPDRHQPHLDRDYSRTPAGNMGESESEDWIAGNGGPYQATTPGSGYTLDSVSFVSARTRFLAHYPVADATAGTFAIQADWLNPGGSASIEVTLNLHWKPPGTDPAQAEYDKEYKDYETQVAALQRNAYGNAIRERLKLVSSMRPRPSEDLRNEERQSVYGNLIRQLELFDDPISARN